jgi:hypothetical protein
MPPRRPRQTRAGGFDAVKAIALTLPDVEATIRYDGSPVLKAGGCFMAGLASHRSAESGTLVVRMGLDQREWLLEDAPDTYYVTDYYRRYPLVLVRLSSIDRDALHDLLSTSWRLTMQKARKRARTRPT